MTSDEVVVDLNRRKTEVEEKQLKQKQRKEEKKRRKAEKEKLEAEKKRRGGRKKKKKQRKKQKTKDFQDKEDNLPLCPTNVNIDDEAREDDYFCNYCRKDFDIDDDDQHKLRVRCSRNMCGYLLCTDCHPHRTHHSNLQRSIMGSIEEKSSNKMFGGLQKVFTHESSECKCKMTFGVFLPPQAESVKCPVLYYLSGLTCTEQNVVTKGGAQRVAAELGIIVVAPDTSPRGCNIEGEDDSYDFGSGAGFYLDATMDKWKKNYRMYSYITKELPSVVNANFPTEPDRIGVFGHSMGGHGSLICALKNPGMYRSVSAFSPICNPINCPWGVKAFSGYLGNDKESWKTYDACELVKSYNGPPMEFLIDQGKKDDFYTDKQLLPENLVSACTEAKVPVTLRMQEDYDHSYYFIATFMEDHIRHHAKFLKA